MQILFSNDVLVSTKSGDTKFHDDFMGESVWVSVNYNPFNNDWRNFNGIEIEDMAAILYKYDQKKTALEIELMSEINKLKDKI